MNEKRLRKSLVLNFIIVALTALGTYMMLSGVTWMGENMTLTATRVEAFKFFTVDSNLLAGLSALILAVFEMRALKTGKPVPKAAILLKLAATSAVALTMLVTALFLSFLVENVFLLYLNANLLFHLVIPLLCVISFIFLDRGYLLRAKDALFGLVPMLCYAVYYTINVFSHAQNGLISPEYDWYYFVQGGVWQMVFVFPIMLLVSYLISLGLCATNRGKQKNR